MDLIAGVFIQLARIFAAIAVGACCYVAFLTSISPKPGYALKGFGLWAAIAVVLTGVALAAT